MRRKAIGLGALICLIVVAALAGSAAAQDLSYKGRTTQGRSITVQTGASGLVSRVAIAFELDCNYTTINAHATFTRPFDRANPQGFKLALKDTVGHGSRTAKGRARIEGDRVGVNLFTGSFKAKAVYYKDGDKYATCRAVGVRWSASRVLEPNRGAHGVRLG